MDVSCPACSARYTADDEKLRGKTARMRCKACSTVWLVSGPGATPIPAAKAEALAAKVDRPETAKLVLPPPELKRAAVVKTGADREKRDLFAERERESDAPPPTHSAKQTLLPPATLNLNNGGVGARNENSVLFRVDQLSPASVGGGRVKTPEPELSPVT
jgi:predicted Zn finger-like uncharacterized protein